MCINKCLVDVVSLKTNTLNNISFRINQCATAVDLVNEFTEAALVDYNNYFCE